MPSDLKALYTDASYEPTLDEWNWLVHEGGAAYKSELSARTVFESELFGMNTSILMSMMEDYLRVPERIATILRHATPTELVRRALPIGNKRSFINLAAMPLHHLTGRELYVDLGRTRSPTGWRTSSPSCDSGARRRSPCAPTACSTTCTPSRRTAHTS